MISIIGIGSCAKIASLFENQIQYNVFKVSSNVGTEKNCKKLPKLKTAEEYENKCPVFGKFFKNIKDEVFVFVNGSEAESGITLKMLEEIKDKNISVFYIRSDLKFLTNLERIQDRVCFQVLQQFARSGLLDKIYLIDKVEVEKIIGQVSLLEYEEKINEFLHYTIHMLNVYKNTDAIMNNITYEYGPSKIFTIGFSKLQDEVKYCYNLSFINEVRYYYAISEKTLQTDQSLLKQIKEEINDNESENIKLMFGIYKTSFEDNFVFALANTKIIQEETP